MYEIKKNIPIPVTPGRKTKYPFREMEIGDCIDGDLTTALAATAFALKNKEYKFMRRNIGDNLYRVWRIGANQ